MKEQLVYRFKVGDIVKKKNSINKWEVDSLTTLKSESGDVVPGYDITPVLEYQGDVVREHIISVFHMIVDENQLDTRKFKKKILDKNLSKEI